MSWCRLKPLAVLVIALPVVVVASASASTAAYVPAGGDSLLDQYAPVFLIEEHEHTYNRIGTPAARATKRGKAEIFVDPSTPTLYRSARTFTTENGTYTNLIYRVHFERSPFTWSPFNAGAGKNVGAMVVITLDENERPVFVSTLQSCGCYHAILPTNHLANSAYPEEWSDAPRSVYGETLPAQLTFPEGRPASHRTLVTIRSGSHRNGELAVMRVDAIHSKYSVIEMEAADMDDLKSLTFDGKTTSFYHERGRRKGLVKGAYKPWETLLFGVWAWDSHVGQDREYGPKDKVGRRFYTTLQFSKKKKADMWDYAGYLRHNGWKP